MPKIRDYIIRKYEVYVRQMIAEALKSSQTGSISSIQLTNYVRNKIESEVKNRINAILAVGTDIGCIRKKGSDRYVLSGGIKAIEYAVENCYAHKFRRPCYHSKLKRHNHCGRRDFR